MNIPRRVRLVVVVAVALLFAAPLVLMFLGSLQTPGLPPADGLQIVPDIVRWANYVSVFQIVDLGVHIRNSVLIAAVAVPLSVLIGSWAGYAIVTAAPKARRVLLIVTVAALMVPTGALLVPRFVMFRWLGLIDTLWAPG